MKTGRRPTRCGRPAGRVRFVSALPKTRSGKLLRRAIQAVCEGRDPGDLTTIEDPRRALQQVPRAGRARRDLRARAALSPKLPPLEDVAREVGQARTLAARQRHVARVRPALEAIDRVGQARAASVR